MQDDSGKIILKKDYMAKRSQMRRVFFLAPNFHGRWFILTPLSLKYYDGSIESGTKRMKGEIILSTVIAVETVDGEHLGNRPYAFQVVYRRVEMNGEDRGTLYIVSVNEDQKQEWIQAIHQACEELNCNFSKMFHRGVWLGKCYSCCSSINKKSEGCQESSVFMKPQISLPVKKQNKSQENESTLESSSSSSKASVARRKTKDGEKSLSKKANLNFTGSLTSIPAQQVDMNSNVRNSARADDLIVHKGHDESGHPMESLNDCKWYHFNLSKHKAIEMLMDDGREGCFIVRDSSRNATFSLSILAKSDKAVKHYRINLNANKGYFITPTHTFDSIQKLIEYHRHNPAGLFTRLKCYPFDDAEIYACFSSVEIAENDLEMKEKIGGGQFGEVFKAVYKHNCEVAVKCVKMNGSSKVGAQSSVEFIEEAKAMMPLNHPNLVRMLGVCRSKPIKIVTEYLKYGSLIQYLRRNKSTISSDLSYMMNMCIQLCSAMEYLEENHIIHRDLAARNCLVGDKQVIKICDFGLARQVDEYNSSAGALFAIRWTAPEGLEFKMFTSKSDVWSFGVLMWEIFTCGAMPYKKIEKNMDVVTGVCAGTLRLQKPDNCPDDVYDILKQCWHEEKEKRPSFAMLFTMLKKLE